MIFRECLGSFACVVVEARNRIATAARSSPIDEAAMAAAAATKDAAGSAAASSRKRLATKMSAWHTADKRGLCRCREEAPAAAATRAECVLCA